ncbi:hypothetical protein P280DRAFT_470710 [Massarina eburnea CBS 473.64]|uniref:Uncharacterized protein n=1 Tax=Massarina eburnea CBS 473.64 TaxID=1395130 RepID=A0A6A6RWE6_9PLEO|nr:hypothetical protein P280DRAFT_470710 [Massarina eburnea CBS 473.64]
MGQQHSVTTTIEIASPPETVRAVVSPSSPFRVQYANSPQFLDWQNYKSWNDRWTLTPLEPSDRIPTDLQPGDKITADMKGTVFRPVIVENSLAAFKWLGSLYGLFEGQHEFHWQRSQTIPGGTTMLQKEDFTGPLTYFVREGSSGGLQTKSNFESFNRDLKAEAEKRASSSA